ncbi:head scaffolding protein [Acinetobacter phage 133]|uniref:Gp22 prohead core scaffold protein n=1 Tax=Acinetobacter phage 133 TaxID=2919552 RepID=D9I6B1_9CAUD|nr:head scaffolding protein [Acinetobacter phage 133]ADJ19492.1 gp22 prohead core scaffold protein [Acinetobacter phage 133]
MLKDQLMQEAQKIEASVELDNIFEGVELSPEVRSQFATVFESVVKKHAVALAETHIEAMANLAESKVEELVESRIEGVEASLVQTAERFCAHLAESWLKDNQVAIDRGIKADLYESMVMSLKDVFVEHNVVVPEESVDVVAEMEEELAEHAITADKLLKEKEQAVTELNTLKRDTALNEATSGLTLTQKEKVSELVEGVEFSDQFLDKVSAIVGMVKNSKLNEAAPATENTLTEGTLNNSDAAALNFQVEDVTTAQTPISENDARMNQYVRATKNIK